MNAFFDQIFSLLTDSPGNLIYHLVLAFSVASALQSAFNHWRSSEFPQVRRTMFGLVLLLLAQFLMFAFSGLNWQGIINPEASLPPLDRAFILFSLVWVTWLWAFPEPSRGADAAAALLSVLIAAAAGLSMLTWPAQSAPGSYNLSVDNFLWQIASIGFIGIGALLLLIRRPNGYWNGLAVLALAFAGHTGHLIFNSDGDYSGVLRLAYMAAFPILLTLPQRFKLSAPAAPAAEKTSAPPPITSIKQDSSVPERRRYSTDPKTFHAMLALAAETNAMKVSRALTRAIAQTMLSDLSFLIYLTDNKNQLIIASGYDLIREENLEGGSLNKGMIPMLSNAIQRGRPLRLPSSSTSADIKGLGEMLGLTNPGHLISVPVLTAEKEVLGAVMLLSPYSNRLWTAEDQAFLANIASSLVPIIQRSQKVAVIEQQGEKIQQAMEAAHAHIQELEQRVSQLSGELQASREREQDQPQNMDADVDALISAQEESQRIIEQLQEENAALREKGRGGKVSREASQLEHELRTTLEEMSRLQNQLADSNLKLMEMERGPAAAPRATEQVEVIASISQELRQPMSSIIGYTDLLLGESVGILGALQRKFVERIKASTERIGTLIEDMIQLNTMETELVGLKPETVDLNAIIDNAMSYTSSQVREKNISMHLELPKKLSSIHADREALQQIFVHLLQNAGAATPVEGKIRLKVETRNEAGQDYVLIQVSDTGGGIPTEDLPRVFTRLYRADNVLIQGVGDTGVGLSIAKTLTEAQHGRIWVESEPGVGATFSVMLPISQDGQLETAGIPKGTR